MADHRRSNSIPTIRLSQPLPALPISLDDIRPRNVPEITIIPYRDDPSAEISHSPKSPPSPTLPPSYEPMYDYLRSQQRPLHLLPSSARVHIMPSTEYRDEPFVISIDADQDFFQRPPPSYEELCIEERELRIAVRELEGDAVPAEEICKFVLAMLLLALTVAGVGTAFHWGKEGCRGLRC